MSKSDQITLLNKYNRSEARRKDLEEQMRIKQEQWKKAEETYKDAEFHTRKLCEEILVRDSSEMILGQLYSWEGLKTADLAVKALASLRKYNEERTDLLRKLLDVSEERRLQIESLSEQIQLIRQYMPSEYQGNADTQEEPEVGKGVDLETSFPVGQGMQRVEMIIEEDEDIQESDLEDIREMAKAVDDMQPVPREIPVHPAKKAILERQKSSQEKSMAHLVDLNEYKDKITDLMWRLIEIVGREGISAYTEIVSRINELMPDMVTNAILRMSVRSIYSMSIFSQEQISDPLRSKFLAYRLTEIGHRLYKDHFGESPVLSELDQIISQHDNANHGYGIRALSTLLTESGSFDSVCYDSKKNTLRLKRGGIYIPDVVAVINGQQHYFEYECGTHTQPDFSAKCNKMLQVTPCLNIVTPSREVLHRRILPQVKAWIKGKGGHKELMGKVVRLTTAAAFKHANPLDDQCWQVVFDMSADEPVIKP